MVSLRRMGGGRKLLEQILLQKESHASRLTKQQHLETHNSQKTSHSRSAKTRRVVK